MILGTLAKTNDLTLFRRNLKLIERGAVRATSIPTLLHVSAPHNAKGTLLWQWLQNQWEEDCLAQLPPVVRQRLLSPLVHCYVTDLDRAQELRTFFANEDDEV